MRALLPSLSISIFNCFRYIETLAILSPSRESTKIPYDTPHIFKRKKPQCSNKMFILVRASKMLTSLVMLPASHPKHSRIPSSEYHDAFPLPAIPSRLSGTMQQHIEILFT